MVSGETSQGILEPETRRFHFELSRRRPDPGLAPFVDSHWIVRWDLGGVDPFTQEILPHAAAYPRGALEFLHLSRGLGGEAGCTGLGAERSVWSGNRFERGHRYG